MGYHRVGFRVVGIDIKPQPHYPFPFIRADAMTFPIRGVDAVHASPPCQAYSSIGGWHKAKGRAYDHPDLYVATRERLQATGKPWVLENVIGAPYQSGVVMCGSHFDLPMRRHRNFETSHLVLAPPCQCKGRKVLAFYGHGGHKALGGQLRPSMKEGPALFGMPWAKWSEVVLAIPPAYTEYIGAELLKVC